MTDDAMFRLVLIAGFAIFLPLMVTFRWRSRTRERLDRRQEGLFILATLRPFGLAAWAGLFAFMINPAWMTWSSLPLASGLRWMGAAVFFLSFVLLAWALRTLGGNLTDTVVTRREHQLVTSGPYHWIRHPFYDSVLLLVLAGGLIAANWFVLFTGTMVFVLLAIRSRTEEANLIARFGEPYRRYRERTGRFLPRVR